MAVLIFAAICALLMVFVMAPIFSSIENGGLGVREQREKIASYERRVLAARDFADFAKKENNNLERINGVFVGQVPLDFINSLEAAARDSLVEIKFSSTKNDDDSTGFEANILGGKEDVLRFLNKIESSLYLVEVAAVDIEAGTGGPESGPAAEAGSRAILDANMPVKARILLKAYEK